MKKMVANGYDGVWERIKDLSRPTKYRKLRRSEIMYKYLYGEEWSRLSALLRSVKGECELCGRKDCVLHVHHIRPISVFVRNGIDGRCDEVVEVGGEKVRITRIWNKLENLMVVCPECHALFHAHMKKF